MKYCRNCGKELNSDIQYCPNCGASVSEEQSGKNENSYQESNADGSLWESLVEFFKALIEYMKEAGLHIIDAIDKIIQMPPNIPKDSICPYCNSEDTFPIVKNETEIKTKGYSMGRGCCGMCLLGPFGLLCGALFTGSKVKSRSITWWGCKNCGRQHLAQHDAVETLSSLMDKMTVNCLCYGALGSLLLYPILDELVHGFLRKDEILRYNVHVINNTGFDIYALYASEPDVDNWEEDLLEDGIVYDGERVDIEFVITEEDLDWDFAIEDFEGNVLEFYGLSFAECDVEGATLILEYDGYKGTASLY